MHTHHLLPISMLILIILVVTACAPQSAATPIPLLATSGPSSDTIRTQAVSTAFSQLTQQAPQSSPTGHPSATPEPSATAIPPTETAQPSETPYPTLAWYTPTLTPSQLDYRCQIQSISPVPNSILPIKADFDGMVKIKNTGDEAWKANEVWLIYTAGTQFQQSRGVALLTADVEPFETGKFIIDMTAPEKAGHYTSSWSLKHGQYYFCSVTFEIEVPE